MTFDAARALIGYGYGHGLALILGRYLLATDRAIVRVAIIALKKHRSNCHDMVRVLIRDATRTETRMEPCTLTVVTASKDGIGSISRVPLDNAGHGEDRSDEARGNQKSGEELHDRGGDAGKWVFRRKEGRKDSSKS